MELYWYIIVVTFIIIKILFYICWYRSRQRQLAAYLSNPRNAQIVIVGGRAYLHRTCDRQNPSVWASWHSSQEDASAGAPTGPAPPPAPYSSLDLPPPYEAVSETDDMKPPPYSELARGEAVPVLPPPYTPSHHPEGTSPESPRVTGPHFPCHPDAAFS